MAEKAKGMVECTQIQRRHGVRSCKRFNRRKKHKAVDMALSSKWKGLKPLKLRMSGSNPASVTSTSKLTVDLLPSKQIVGVQLSSRVP